LNQRGIILAINSKNNYDDAIQVINEHPNMLLRAKNFAVMKINWQDKVSNIQEIAEELNIGLDSMVYLDDEPMNREFMKERLPQIITVDLPQDPSEYSSHLMSLNDFNLVKITTDDKNRGEMYYQEKQRKEFKKTIPNLEDFLKKLNIQLEIKNADNFSIPRISQLTLKTNQFNLTTTRYQEEDIKNFVNDKKTSVGCVKVSDKFGDNGITGAYIIKKNDDEWLIDTFLLSCRVMGRGIEDGMLGHILEQAKKEGVSTVKGQFIPTKKNMPCSNFFADYGFQKDGDLWSFSLSNSIKIPKHLTIKK